MNTEIKPGSWSFQRYKPHQILDALNRVGDVREPIILVSETYIGTHAVEEELSGLYSDLLADSKDEAVIVWRESWDDEGIKAIMLPHHSLAQLAQILGPRCSDLPAMLSSIRKQRWITMIEVILLAGQQAAT